MAKTINGIQFNNLRRIGKGSKAANLAVPGISSEDDLQDYIDAEEEYRNIQSVLIDWNGADLSSALGEKYSSINTTGQLLSWIKEDLVNTTIIGRNSEMIRRSLWIN